MRSEFKRRLSYSFGLTALSSLLFVPTLRAQVPQLAGEGEVAAAASQEGLFQTEPPEATTTARASEDAGGEGDFLRRYAPEAGLFEVGAFTGPVFISDANSFRGAATLIPGQDVVLKPLSNYKQPALEMGLRAAYFPLSFLGAELEAMVAAAETDEGQGATTLAGRGHVILQSPFWSVVPFLVGGIGYWHVMNDVSGDDSDPAFHYGGGAKVNILSNLAVRLDVRDSVTNRRPTGGGYPHNVEVLVGANLVLGRKPKVIDSDGDGLNDERDQCPMEAGTLPNGCAVRDSDADGVMDPEDQCIAEPGEPPTGCPVALDTDQDGIVDTMDQCVQDRGGMPTGCPDTDQDQVFDKDDKCPELAGAVPDGCPIDPDGDGLIGAADLCPNKAEVRNGFEDADGCPDELPAALKNFVGVIAGIEFDNNKDVIRPGADVALERAVGVLLEYPTLRVQIIGHTDDRGKRELNLDLSQRRAEAVRAHLIGRGIDSKRIEARGAGPDQPMTSNETGAGRQRNRRIEFKIIE